MMKLKYAQYIKYFLNLYRLPIPLACKAMIYYLKKIFHFEPNYEEKDIIEYFLCLILINGTCKEECEHELVTHLHAGIDIISRKRPSSDLSVFQQVWIHKQYQPVVDFMKDTIRNRDDIKIVDAGGYVGYTALFFKKEFPGSNILILEPEDSNYILLERNIKLNNCQDLNLLRAGIWKRQSCLEVKKDFRDGKEWSYYVQEASYLTKLKGYSVTDLLKKYKWERIDLFKIDIEGGERYLFENEEQAKTFLSMTKFIAIEIHDEFNIRDKIYKCLADNRFEYFTVGELTIGRNRDYV